LAITSTKKEWSRMMSIRAWLKKVFCAPESEPDVLEKARELEEKVDAADAARQRAEECLKLARAAEAEAVKVACESLAQDIKADKVHEEQGKQEWETRKTSAQTACAERVAELDRQIAALWQETTQEVADLGVKESAWVDGVEKKRAEAVRIQARLEELKKRLSSSVPRPDQK
jgi:hypothetical protein